MGVIALDDLGPRLDKNLVVDLGLGTRSTSASPASAGWWRRRGSADWSTTKRFVNQSLAGPSSSAMGSKPSSAIRLEDTLKGGSLSPAVVAGVSVEVLAVSTKSMGVDERAGSKPKLSLSAGEAKKWALSKEGPWFDMDETSASRIVDRSVPNGLDDGMGGTV